jgi:1-acyl-sn-glycerol-3-phosphate acyltransferase
MWLRYSILRPVGLIIARRQKYNVRWSGIENAPSRGPFIVVSNHQTFVDWGAIALALHKTAMRTEIVPWAKVEIAQGLEGKLGWILWRVFKVIPIDREANGEMPNTIRASLNYLRKGKIVMVFPEGTRYPRGEMGPFKFGVANLARGAPAPILPVGCWRRDEDNGIQVNIGKPFFMPNIRRPLKKLTELEEIADDRISNRIDVLKQWGEGVTRDRKGMKMIANMVGLVVQSIEKQEITFDAFCKLAEAEDNRYLQDKIMELLPDWFKKVEDKVGEAESTQRYQHEETPQADSEGVTPEQQ